MEKNEPDQSQQLFDEIISGMKEWRASHPKATMREIEVEARKRVSRLEAHLIEESALGGQAKEWAGKPPEERPTCVNCGEPLVARGKQKRRLQATMGREIELERTYGTCPKCEAGFFPLDEELGLLPGSLTPLQQEHLVHLALWVSFPKAVKLLAQLMGVQVSEATARRQTEEVGAAYEAVQNEQASHLLHEQENKSKKGRAKSCQPSQRVETEPAPKLMLSSDGAMVPLVGGVWAEAKTVVIAEIQRKDKVCKQRPEQQVEAINLSYFSRLTDSETFGRLATVETERRGVGLAKEVCAVQDGAEWIQGFVDLHRPDAVRILDFAHAASYLSEIAELMREAGSPLPQAWLDQQLHELKHQGPAAVLKEVRRVRDLHPHIPDLDQKVNYLCKREPYMQYPRYQEQGWPIGSGSVESANNGVVQARLKGAGMRWERSHVNPLLALRTAVCHDQWEPAWLQACQQCLREGQERRRLRQQTRWQAAVTKLRQLLLRLLLLLSPARSKTSPPQPQPPPQLSSGSTASTVLRRPASDHPWRRRLLAKK